MGHVTNRYAKDYQPMNINFGLFPPSPGRGTRREKRRRMVERALTDLELWKVAIT
jgi:methylenetetrahydrofolate--tRNA-(uracil-5-)-methyltransferase